MSTGKVSLLEGLATITREVPLPSVILAVLPGDVPATLAVSVALTGSSPASRFFGIVSEPALAGAKQVSRVPAGPASVRFNCVFASNAAPFQVMVSSCVRVRVRGTELAM